MRNLIKFELRKIFKNYLFIGLILLYSLVIFIELPRIQTYDFELASKFTGEFNEENLDYAQQIYDELIDKRERIIDKSVGEQDHPTKEFIYNGKTYRYGMSNEFYYLESPKKLKTVNYYIYSYGKNLSSEELPDSNEKIGELRPKILQYDNMVEVIRYISIQHFILPTLLIVIAICMAITKDNNRNINTLLRVSKRGKKYLHVRYLSILIATVIYTSLVFLIMTLILQMKFNLFEMLPKVEYYVFGNYVDGVTTLLYTYLFVVVYTSLASLFFANISIYTNKSIVPILIFIVLYFVIPIYINSRALHSSTQTTYGIFSSLTFIEMFSPIFLVNNGVFHPSNYTFYFVDEINRINIYGIKVFGINITQLNYEYFILGVKLFIISAITFINSKYYLKKYEKVN